MTVGCCYLKRLVTVYCYLQTGDCWLLCREISNCLLLLSTDRWLMVSMCVDSWLLIAAVCIVVIYRQVTVDCYSWQKFQLIIFIHRWQLIWDIYSDTVVVWAHCWVDRLLKDDHWFLFSAERWQLIVIIWRLARLTRVVYKEVTVDCDYLETSDTWFLFSAERWQLIVTIWRLVTLDFCSLQRGDSWLLSGD